MKWVLVENVLKKGGKHKRDYSLHQARFTPLKGAFCWGGEAELGFW